jgi:hypothetical protein
MGRGAATTATIERTQALPPTRYKVHAHLCSGPGDGSMIRLDAIEPEMFVYRQPESAGGELVPLADPGLNGSAGQYLGTYQLSNGPGPEPPLYVWIPGA